MRTTSDFDTKTLGQWATHLSNERNAPRFSGCPILCRFRKGWGFFAFSFTILNSRSIRASSLPSFNFPISLFLRLIPESAALRPATPAYTDPAERVSTFSAASISTNRPAFITATRVASCATTGRLCEIKISVSENSRCSRASSSRICAPTDTSSADTGSSAITSSGRKINARAIPIRCLWPPENSCGYRSSASAPIPTASRISIARSRRFSRKVPARESQAAPLRFRPLASADSTTQLDPETPSASFAAALAELSRALPASRRH